VHGPTCMPALCATRLQSDQLSHHTCEAEEHKRPRRAVAGRCHRGVSCCGVLPRMAGASP
jgi:hypothetical protein